MNVQYLEGYNTCMALVNEFTIEDILYMDVFEFNEDPSPEFEDGFTDAQQELEAQAYMPLYFF